ncbi:unnamed protein product [Lepidochelys olivacea]
MGLYQPTSLQSPEIATPGAESQAQPAPQHRSCRNRHCGGLSNTNTTDKRKDVNRLKVDHLRMKAVLPLYKAG